MNEISGLYQNSLLQLGIDEGERAILEQVGQSLISQGDAFRRLQLAIVKKESFYSYSSLLGTSVTMEFDWEREKVTLAYLGSELVLSMKDFRIWLSCTDLLLAPILPLGSLVELDRKLLPEELVSEMEKAKVPFMAMIMGRRLLSEPDDREYIDYLVSIYPYGMRLDVEPLFIPSYLISHVIQEGYSDTLDQSYVDRQYRKDYFRHRVFSMTHSIEGEDR
ncbi:hypothetical protein D8869_11190 [Streptococcus sanguinis]|uniref:DUF4176 domain-containing protein n=1 Tax=Streptococcus sanguinis TaxID=1305 RepID=A0AB74DQW4_STRSA|nr:DUF4176 domain-containing protein [Streptococcus sanguinis]RSI11405.1 hypothetical protein D8885_10955 [Streptococcus sanguinis]RSI51193.1 hypothetical protein D8869_11190 [Streptococcus sanguinis]